MTPELHSTCKICNSCKKEKPLSEFGKNRLNRDGHAYGCKQCRNSKHRNDRKLNPAKYRGEYRKRVDANGPEWKRKNIRRIGFIKFRVNEAWFDAKLASQGGRCGICGTSREHQQWSRFCIDHDHECCGQGKACDKCRRDLLCHKCNIKLGMIEDADWIGKAIKYLTKHGKYMPGIIPNQDPPSILMEPSEQPHMTP